MGTHSAGTSSLQALQGGVGEVLGLKAHPALQGLEEGLPLFPLEDLGGDAAFPFGLRVAGVGEEEGPFPRDQDLGVLGVGEARKVADVLRPGDEEGVKPEGL